MLAPDPDFVRVSRDPEVIGAIRAHARACFPREACGALTRDGYRPFANVAAEPLHHFDCDAERTPLLLAGAVLAMVHSHPFDPSGEQHPVRWSQDGPSAHDQRNQRADALPWGLVAVGPDEVGTPFFWGDMLEPPPLEGRQFRHGPSGTDGRGDCGAIIRDWFRFERGVLVPDFARDDHWWEDGEDHYAANFARAGFRHADPTWPAVGDVVLLQVRSRSVPNHAGVYVGHGLILHHLEKRLSRREPFGPWRRMARAWLRHESQPDPEAA